MPEEPTTAETAAVPIGATRIHVALGVHDLEASLAFYRTLFQQEPTKLRDGYAKFEVADPSVNLTLNATAAATGTRGPEHFGIQVGSTAEVGAHHGRMRAAGFSTTSEEGVTCCFAVQDKFWAVDPDGHRWEVFVVLEADADAYYEPPEAAETDAEPCCAPSSLG